MRFLFYWHQRKRNAIEQVNIITLSQPIEDIKIAASVATEIFIKSFGNLKKNEITEIYALNKDGEKIGEPIILKKKNDNGEV